MTVRKIRDTMTASLAKIQQQFDDLPAQAFLYWQQQTPKRSGNARRRTRLRGSTIDANYAYAQRLDEGWSQQSPDGMTKPTDKYIEQLVKRIGK